MIESHLISWHVGFHGRNYILHGMVMVSVRPLQVHLGGEYFLWELSLLGVAHPLWEKHFRSRTNTDGRCSSKAVIVKKAEMWPCYSFCRIY